MSPWPSGSFWLVCSLSYQYLVLSVGAPLGGAGSQRPSDLLIEPKQSPINQHQNAGEFNGENVEAGIGAVRTLVFLSIGQEGSPCGGNT